MKPHVLFGALLLAGCASGSSSSPVVGTPVLSPPAPEVRDTAPEAALPAVSSLVEVDFLNFTYPGVTYACSDGDASCSITVRDGVAPVSVEEGYGGGQVSVGQVHIGPFGSGPEPLAFVALYLAGEGLLGNRAGAVPYYYLYRLGSAGRPQLVARADEEVGASSGIDPVRSGLFVRGDQLVLSGAIYGPSDATCCPSQAGEVTLGVRDG